MRTIVLMALCSVSLAVAGVVVSRSAGESSIVRELGRTPLPADPPFASPFAPLPFRMQLDARKVALGDRLFHERRLSRDGSVSCNSCHDLTAGGADTRRVSRGMDGHEGTLNAPTVFNGSFNFRQFWDGRAETLEQQIDGPLLHSGEMAASWDELLATLRADASYAGSFGSLYPEGVTKESVRDAIATFERSLVTPNSRFDRYLRGELDVLTAPELAGYRLFIEVGCATCHQGINVGGNMFQKFGRMADYFADRGDVQPADQGRFNVTGNERDRHKFKVPSLRNVALTAPYFHDGSTATLGQAVQIMARYQIGQSLEDDEVAELVAFLGTLTGEKPRRP